MREENNRGFWQDRIVSREAGNCGDIKSTDSGEATIRRLILVVLLAIASAMIVWAGCKTDCNDEYDSAVESCNSSYDDPEDSDDLTQCIQSAKDESQSCIEECDN
jgi:outer membrane murein-binding lipoprotein Lpp